MKIITILTALLVAIPALKAQKQEIKKAQKAVNAGQLSSASSYLQQAKRIFAAADDKTRAHYYVVEAEMNLANKNLDKDKLELISNSVKLANSYNPDSSLINRIAEIEQKLKGLSATAAAGEFSKKKYSEAAILYNVAYDSTKDTIHYFNAARSHLLAKEYGEAFRAYSSLFNMGYTNAKTRYVATNVETGKQEAFSSLNTRNSAVRQGTHKKPALVTTSSKVPELLRGITAAAIQLNKQHTAVIFIDQALAKIPNDRTLLNQAFHLYSQLDAKDKYYKIMDLLIKETPKDPTMYYNFAMSSAQNNDLERAKKFYKKTLELKANHTNAKLNLTNLLLKQEANIVDEMNSLGIPANEDKRYEELKVERNSISNELLPYLESIVASQPKNKEWVTKLITIYDYLGKDTKLASLQEKLDD